MLDTSCRCVALPMLSITKCGNVETSIEFPACHAWVITESGEPINLEKVQCTTIHGKLYVDRLVQVVPCKPISILRRRFRARWFIMSPNGVPARARNTFCNRRMCVFQRTITNRSLLLISLVHAPGLILLLDGRSRDECRSAISFRRRNVIF